MYTHIMTHDTCVHGAWHMAGVRIVSLSVDLRYEVVNYTHCSTPHTIALLLQALKAQHGHILASFLGPAQFICLLQGVELRYQDVSYAHCYFTCSCSSSANLEGPTHLFLINCK